MLAPNAPLFLAQAGAQPAEVNPYAQYLNFIILAVMFLLFYLLLIRPQQKRQKERNRMLASLSRGDKVVTIGGLHGTIDQLTDDTVVLRVGDGVRLTFDRQAISTVIKDKK
ncbi:preprotein translocase subunit YajC [Hydrogenibacillus sp. N12]|uniref:preprotein translocase subunit YajC n=1 Tax=Hydrogenibacillus sp. N12 TaxID=2866627 RepID=UPI001C7D7241|nr:preprotein translocase subunit YajC [Hydrogenibacillus sp. N12]QZA33882.1 preprotein translocase subunit YajC [Hydrogenibacillus sp. N12]